MKSCYVDLESLPPGHMANISKRHQFGAGQSRRDEECDGPADAASDSDDGLFITQKPVPEAVRSRRRLLHTPSPPSTSPRQEEDEAGPSFPSSLAESRSVTTRRIKNLPKYSFSFVTEKRPRAAWVSARQNRALHNYAMGGFFKCVKELWQGRQRGDDPQAPLPTVDMDGENISPLSDDEDAWSESEDIKVVERTRFVARLKPKCSQPRHNPDTGGISGKRKRRSASEGQEVSRMKTQNKPPTMASTAFPLDTKSSDNNNRHPPRRVLTEKETSDKHVTSDGSILVHTETPGTNRRLNRVSKMLFQGNEREEELCDDSDATYCEPSELQLSPWEHTEKDREASPNVTEPQTDVFTTDDLSQAEDEPESQSLLRSLPVCVTDGYNERVRNVSGAKRRKAKGDCESVEERGDQSHEEPQGLPAARSLCVEAEETPRPTQTSDELELNEENRMANLSQGRRKENTEKKRKKNKLAKEVVGQGEDGNRESEERAEKDSLFLLTGSVANGGEEKKRKVIVEGDEQLPSSVLQPLNDDAERWRKKGKLVNMEETSNMALDLPLISKEQLEETGHRLENTGSSQATEDYESVQERVGESREEPGGVPAARSVHSETAEDNRAEPPATQASDELELNEDNGMENLTRHAILARQEERRIRDSKLTKKRSKKNKLAADDVGQKKNGNRESEVRAEKDSLLSLTCQVVNGGEEKKKNKKENKRKRVAEGDESSVLEPLNDDAETRRKKEKKLVNMEEHGEEATLNMASDLPLISKEQLEETGHSLENTEKKKKKKKRKRIVEGDGDIELLQSSAVSEPLIDDAETQRKKKRRKKEKKLVNTEEHGEEDALDMASDPPLVSKEQEMGRCLENTESSQERLEASCEKKRKKQKKRRRLSDPRDEAQAAVEDGVELNNVSMEESTEQSVKKKKKKKQKGREGLSEGVDVSCTPDKNTKADDVENTQKTKEGPESGDAASVRKKKKKKKKKSETFSRHVSEDAVAQSDDSGSVRKRERRRTPSFLVADAEEKDAQTLEEVEQSSTFSKSAVVSALAGALETESAEMAGGVEPSHDDGVRKKKRKRKRSEVQKDHERDFEEANETRRGALPEATDAGVKRNKKPMRNGSDPVTAAGRSERADDAGHCQTDEAVAFKKKKKNKVAPHHATQGSPPTDSVESEGDASVICSSVSLSRKDKRSAFPLASQKSPGRRAAVSHDQSTSDKASEETRNKPHLASPPSQTRGIPVVNGVSDKKKKKNEHKRTKRQLHNPSEDFLTDS
ncbi:hypothetical protein F2P81_008599 [Scophthalmus maximus]|uniref:Uncharacterized protein n=1 Tax=Scophthalmus maximus TaxID=52904 RepID=A0A6A4SZB0_SCOMX|nr:hypothetical protein F2P81_008599 [Scophthalmus maximus]